MISSRFITCMRNKVGCQHLRIYKIIFFFFVLAEKGCILQENMWLSNQEKSARILVTIMLAILDSMRTSYLACNRIPTCLFRVLLVTLCNKLYI